jgi:hypothetical protein
MGLFKGLILIAYTYWYLVIIGLLVLVIIIGVAVNWTNYSFRKRQKAEVERVERERIKKLKAFLERSDREQAMDLKIPNIRMLSIYRSGKLFVNMHNEVIKGIVTAITKQGYKMKMSSEDYIIFLECNCPVLVIVPSLKVYFFHDDQTEDRTGSDSKIVESDNVKSNSNEIEYLLGNMEGVDAD